MANTQPTKAYGYVYTAEGHDELTTDVETCFEADFDVTIALVDKETAKNIFEEFERYVDDESSECFEENTIQQFMTVFDNVDNSDKSLIVYFYDDEWFNMRELAPNSEYFPHFVEGMSTDGNRTLETALQLFFGEES